MLPLIKITNCKVNTENEERQQYQSCTLILLMQFVQKLKFSNPSSPVLLQSREIRVLFVFLFNKICSSVVNLAVLTLQQKKRDGMQRRVCPTTDCEHCLHLASSATFITLSYFATHISTCQPYSRGVGNAWRHKSFRRLKINVSEIDSGI